VAIAAAALGTPFAPYFLQLPSYSHVCSALAVALLLWLGARWRHGWSARRAAVLGAAVGFAGLVRVQDLAFGVLPLGLAVWGGAVSRRQGGGPVAVYGATAVAAFVPQLLAWKAIYGSAWTLPQGAGFLRLSAAGLGGVLFSSRHGLLAWSPVVAAALVGIGLLLREPRTRGLGWVLLVAFGMQWILAALPADWWAGWSFGARRFVDCTRFGCSG
jgi:hypothetical protein